MEEEDSSSSSLTTKESALRLRFAPASDDFPPGARRLAPVRPLPALSKHDRCEREQLVQAAPSAGWKQSDLPERLQRSHIGREEDMVGEWEWDRGGEVSRG